MTERPPTPAGRRAVGAARDAGGRHRDATGAGRAAASDHHLGRGRRRPTGPSSAPIGEPASAGTARRRPPARWRCSPTASASRSGWSRRPTRRAWTRARQPCCAKYGAGAIGCAACCAEENLDTTLELLPSLAPAGTHPCGTLLSVSETQTTERSIRAPRPSTPTSAAAARSRPTTGCPTTIGPRCSSSWRCTPTAS